MKELNITLKFNAPDDSAIIEANELAGYIVDCIWDEFHDLDYELDSFEVSEDGIVQMIRSYK